MTIFSVFNLFGGRCTTFAITFTVVGIILACTGRLDMSYVGLVSAVQTLLVAHSIKEDYFNPESNSCSPPS